MSGASAAVATVAAFVVGAVVALQARFNGDFAQRLGGGFSGGAVAATANFTVGLAMLTAWLLFSARQRSALASLVPAVRAGRLRLGQCFGGLGGAFLILSQSASVPTIGVAVFTVAVVGGQTGAGLFVDQVGLGPAGRQPVTTRRVVAAAVAVGAVVVSVSGRFGSASFAPGLIVLCLAAGGAVAVQSALNGQVGRATGSAVAASWLNFALGWTVLLVVVGAMVVGGHRFPSLPRQWWLYTGGLMGVAFVTVVAAVVRTIGVLVVTLATVAGQVAGAVVLDAVAPVAGQALQLVTVVGAAATLAAVLMAVRSGPRQTVRPTRRSQ